MRLSVVALLVAGSLALAAPPAAAHTPHSDIFDVAASPQFGTDHTLLTISRGLLFRSSDAGTTWQRLVRGLDHRSQFYAVGFGGTSNLRAWTISGDAVFRSDNRGLLWRRVRTASPPPGDLRVLATSPVAADSALVAGSGSGASVTDNGGTSWRTLGASPVAITSATYSPASAQVILVGDVAGSLHVTGDAGLTWSHHPLPAGGAVTTIAPSPSYATDGLALVGTATGGVFRWDASAQTLTAVNAGLTDPRVTSLAYSAAFAQDGTVYASTWNVGTFTSTDGGTTWQPATTGLVKDPQPTQAAYSDRPNFGEVVTAFADAGGLQPVAFLASFTGLYSSIDGAASWQGIETLSSGIVMGLAVSPQYGTDHTLAISTYVNGAFTSTDSGQTFQASNLGLGESKYWSVADHFTRLYGITIAPVSGTTTWMFSAQNAGVLRSSNGGASWQKIFVPGFSDSVDTATAPRVPLVLVSPTFATDHTVFMIDGGKGDVFRSVDDGASFQKVGHIPNRTHCLQAAPTFAVDHRLLACTGAGVYVSTNLGVTWTATRVPPAALVSLAVTATPGSTETWFAATGSGLYRSVNLGQQWTVVALPFPNSSTAQVLVVAASPPGSGPATVLATVKGRGLMRSTDGGATFAATASQLINTNEQLDNFNFKPTSSPIVFSPAFDVDRTVFGYSHARLFRSVDGGGTFQPLVVPKATHGSVFPTVPRAPAIGPVTRGNRSISVSFTPGSDVGTPIVRFDATCTSSDGGMGRSASGSSSPVLVGSLTNGKTYTCRVTGTNLLGTGPTSAASSATVPATVPSAPVPTAAVPANQQVTVSWSPPASDGGSPITGYRVTPVVGFYVLPSVTFASTATTQTITGLTNGTAYRFTVAALNAVGTGASKGIGPVTPTATVPTAPVGPLVAIPQSGGATISWGTPTSDGGSAITGYVVTPYVGFFPLDPVTFASTATTQTVTGLTNGTTYRFKVAAVNAIGTGPSSVVTNPIVPG